MYRKKESGVKTNKVSESKLQQEIFTWHWNTRPSERGLLFMVYNTPPNAKAGAMLKGMGMIAGVSDMIYLSPLHGAIMVELKTDEGRQSTDQKKWQKAVENAGYRYVIVRSLEDFKKIIEQHL